MKQSGFFVAATGQNVGKTTSCLGLVSGLKKRLGSVGFLKPVGQEQVLTPSGLPVDKDVILFKDHFHLKESLEEMSPVLFPKGFTRNYLDGQIDHDEMIAKIKSAYETISNHSEATVIEGTGHTGVGSIVNLNNAQVAKILNSPVLLIAPGGLGSSFDELSLNILMCKHHGARVAGVILNRVLEDKRDMVDTYMRKALSRWDIPLLGSIPFNAFLSAPSMQDFEHLFQCELISGESHRLRHFRQIRLASKVFERSKPLSHHLIVTPADQEEVLLSILTRYWDAKISHYHETLETGIILTGKRPPKESIVEQVKKADIPMLYVPVSSFIAMKMISSHISKIRTEDTVKVQQAIHLVESHIDFDHLLACL